MQNFLFFLLLGFAVSASIRKQKLTVAGALTGGLLAMLLFFGLGFYGIVLLGAFFLLGTGATAWKATTKKNWGLQENESGKRTMGQVLANGGVAGILGFLALLSPNLDYIWALLIAGSFASATADTLSSELGTIYGKRFYNILTFKKDLRGLDGVISVEGTLLGIGGSAIVGGLYVAWFGGFLDFLIILIAGTVGNLMDSILGATLERKGGLSNNAVNFINTLVGALTALVLYIMLY